MRMEFVGLTECSTTEIDDKITVVCIVPQSTATLSPRLSPSVGVYLLAIVLQNLHILSTSFSRRRNTLAGCAARLTIASELIFCNGVSPVMRRSVTIPNLKIVTLIPDYSRYVAQPCKRVDNTAPRYSDGTQVFCYENLELENPRETERKRKYFLCDDNT